MSTRTLRNGTPSLSIAASRTESHADAPVVPTPVLSKAAAARLARLGEADMPWLGQGDDEMLADYDGPEVSGPIEYSAARVKGR